MPIISLSAFKNAARTAQASAAAGTSDPGLLNEGRAISNQSALLDLKQKIAQMDPNYAKNKALSDLLSPDEASGFGLPYGSTKSDAAGKKFVTKANQDKLDALSNAGTIIDQIANASKAVNHGTVNYGPTSIFNSIKGKLGLDQNAKQLQEAPAFISNLSRTLGGEKGVLTDQDVARIQSAVPSVYDNEQTAQRKISVLKDILNQAKTRAGGGSTDPLGLR